MQLFAPGKDELFGPAADASVRAAQLTGALLGPFDLADHESWRATAVREGVAVRVGAPESRGAYLKRYTSFLVSLPPASDGVRRRYSDFAWLCAVLHARYTDLLVPSLPEKTAAASVAALRGRETALLLGRARGLTLFHSAVLASPYLRSDAAVHCFLSVADDAQWEAAKKETAVMDNAGIGHLRWLHRVLNAHVASSPDSAIAAFRRHVEQQEAAAAALVAAAKRLTDCSAAAAKDVAALHSAFLGWQSASSQDEEDDEAFRSVLGMSVSVVGAWSQVAQFQPVVHELLLLESARYLLHQAADLNELLAEREQLLQAAEAPAAPAESPTPFQGFSFGGVSFFSTPAQGFGPGSSFSTTASQLASRLRGASDPSAVDVEAHRRRARHVGGLMTRALVAEEMCCFRSDKTQALRELMGRLACAEAQMAKRSSSLWREFLKTTDADNETLVADTKQTLDGAAAYYAPGGGDGAGSGAADSAEAY